MKRIFGLLLFTLAAFALSLHAAEKPVLKIGVIAPLTGDNAAVGESMRDGCELALKEFADSPVQVKLVYEDDQMVNQKTNLAAQRLIQLEKVNMIVSLWTPAANLLAPLTEKAKVIEFNTGWDTGVTEKYKWTLVHGGDYREFAKSCVEIIKAAGAKKVAIVAVQHLGCKKVVDATLPVLKQAGVEVVFNEPFVPGERDFHTYVLKMMAAKPDYFLNLTMSPEDGIFLRALKQQGVKLPSTGFYYYTQPQWRPLFEGAIYPDLATKEPFNQEYIKAYGHEPKHVEAGHCRDIIRITAQAVNDLYQKLGRMPTNEELLAAMKEPRSLELAVGSGAMNPAGYVESHYMLKQIKDGKVIDYQK